MVRRTRAKLISKNVMFAALISMLGFSTAGCRQDAGAGEGGTGGTSMGGDDGDTGATSSFVPAPGGARRLLLRELQRSVERMFGYEAARVVTEPSDLAHEGWNAVGATELGIGPTAVEAYERVATQVADAVIASPATLAATVPCITNERDLACYEEVAKRVGHWAFRRPLSAVEIDELIGIAVTAQDWGDGDFDVGLKYALMAILQSPSFLYISTVGEVNPESGHRELTAAELATRLSFFLLGHNPDLELLEAAERGELDTPEAVRRTARRMVESADARVALNVFFDEVLRLRYLSETSKDATLFPSFDEELANFMRQETLLLVNDIVWERDADYRELFNARYTFVNDPLAELYGLPPTGTGSLFTRVELPPRQMRAGFLSQASFNTVHATARRTSPTKRGKYVQERVLCRIIPAPASDADLNLPEPEPGMTMRDLLELHMENLGCRACHAVIDPVGFAYEPYDAIGAFRDLDNGAEIDPSGAIVDLGEWSNAAELGDILAADPRTGQCLIENLIGGRLGHLPFEGEEEELARLNERAAEDGYRLKKLLVDIATSPLFSLVDEPK